MNDFNNKESLRPQSMAGSETTTVANSTVPSVMEQKEMATSAAPSAASVREREQSAEPQVAAESTEKSPQDTVRGGGSVSDEDAEDDFVYPQGWQLTIITIALAFSVFCMALVSRSHKYPPLMTRKLTTLTGQHHSRYRHSPHYRPVQGPQRCGVVWILLPAYHLRHPTHLWKNLLLLFNQMGLPFRSLHLRNRISRLRCRA
jgi:hypothetical protein